jgi:hypothetical protein
MVTHHYDYVPPSKRIYHINSTEVLVQDSYNTP